MNRFFDLHLKAIKSRKEISGICTVPKPTRHRKIWMGLFPSLCRCPDNDGFSEHTAGRGPFPVLQEADFEPWPLTQCGRLGGTRAPEAALALSPGPAHEQVPQVIVLSWRDSAEGVPGGRSR